MVALGSVLGEVRLSHDGRRVGYVARSGDSTDLIIRSVSADGRDVGPEEVITTAPRLSGPHPDGGGSWCWSADSQWIVFVGRDHCLWKVPAGGGVPSLLVEPHGMGRGLGLWSPAVSPDNRWVAYTQENNERADIAVVAFDGSDWPHRITTERSPEDSEHRADFVLDPAWGPKGWLAWHAWKVPDMPWDGGWIALAHIDERGNITDRKRLDHGSVGQPRWSVGGSLAFVADDGPTLGDAGFKNLTILDGLANVDRPDSGATPGLPSGRRLAEPFEHADPTWGPGQRSFCWSPDGSSLAFERNEEGFGRLCIVNSAGVVSQLGRGVHRSLSWTNSTDGSRALIAAIRQGATTPTQIVLYGRGIDDHDAEWERTVLARGPVGGWESADLVEPTVIRYRSIDGAEVCGRLYRPTHAVGPTPVIVSVHGGPSGQTRVTWNPRFVFLLARGWSVFVPDYRGSTGLGRAYQQSLNERWGELDVSDTVAGIRHLVAEGFALPDAVVAMGGSAGGFTVLTIMAKHPSDVAGGISLYGVTDLLDLDESTHRFERHYQRALIGPRPATEYRYLERSPVNFAADISAPLLVLHGDADESVVVGQSHALVDAMRRAGREVELVVYPGEGHGWRQPETTIDELRRIERFLARFSLGAVGDLA